MLCSNCHKQIKNNINFCPYCGNHTNKNLFVTIDQETNVVSPVINSDSTKNIIARMIIAILLVILICGTILLLSK